MTERLVLAIIVGFAACYFAGLVAAVLWLVLELG